MNLQRYGIIVWKEFIHIFRDPISLRIAILMPLLFTLVFGYAVTTDVEHIKLAVFDGDKTYESRELIRKFVASNYFDLATMVNSATELEHLLDGGEVKAALTIPSGYGRQLKRGEMPESLLTLDGTDPTIARTALQSGNLVSNMYNMQTLTGGTFRVAEMKTRVWYNPNMKSAMFIIPGLIGLIMQNITIMLTAFALVREREKGTIEQLMVSPPTGRADSGKDGALYHHRLRGFSDRPLLRHLVLPRAHQRQPAPAPGPGLHLCHHGPGHRHADLHRGPEPAAGHAVLLCHHPAGGAAVGLHVSEGMPLPIYLFGNLIPLTYFLEILRGIILKGWAWSTCGGRCWGSPASGCCCWVWPSSGSIRDWTEGMAPGRSFFVQLGAEEDRMEIRWYKSATDNTDGHGLFLWEFQSLALFATKLAEESAIKLAVHP